MFSKSFLNGQVKRCLSFTTSLSVGSRSLQPYKLCVVCNSRSRYFCRNTLADRFDNLRKEFFRFSYRGLGTGKFHHKQQFTSYDENDNILMDEAANACDFNQDSITKDDDHDSTSHVKLRSGPVEYTLNEDGFIEIHDLVDFLKRENAIDICVIKTTGDKRSYVDYFVVVSGTSTRHLRAMAKNLEQLFRGHEVRGIGRAGHVVVEGLESDHWVALDIGNIVIHFFLPEVREVYELEKLWTLGPKYDDQTKAMLEREKFLKAAELGQTLDKNAGVTDDTKERESKKSESS